MKLSPSVCECEPITIGTPQHWPTLVELQEPRADLQRPKPICEANHGVLLGLRLRLRLRPSLQLVLLERHGVGMRRQSPWIKVRTQLPTPSADPTAHFFDVGEKCEKIPAEPHPRHQASARMKQQKLVREDLHHVELKSQRDL